MSERIREIKTAVERHAGVPAEHVESVPIKETFQGQTVWEGVVETFVLLGHPKASRAYGWRIGEGKSAKYKTVLQTPPIDSARDAVRAAVVEEVPPTREVADAYKLLHGHRYKPGDK